MYDDLNTILLTNLYLTSVKLDTCEKKKDIVSKFFSKKIKKALQTFNIKEYKALILK